jgi:predicted ArsR family transcriptional regulator
MALQNTKSEILALLKRSAGSGVEQLASALNLARMSVRQHLATLERDNLFGKLARRVANQYAQRLESKSLEERVSAVVDILQAENGFAETRKRAEGFEIVAYNCPYRKVADSQNEVCVWHLELLS